MKVTLLAALAAALSPPRRPSAFLRAVAVKKESACECVPLPDSVPRNKQGLVKSTSGDLYPSTYGAVCAAHDQATDACKGKYKAAWCNQKWCYVSKDCKAEDTKDSFFFGKAHGIHYSYQNCGGIDAFAAEMCAGQTEKACPEFSDNCAWNKPSQGCQNKLCQCTGSNGGMDVAKHGFQKGYGETCEEWDEKSCEEYAKKGDGYNMGLWCCKSWCYVDEGCASAEKSVVGDGLFYSYFACPDDIAALTQCKWQEPIDFGGEPVPLSSEAAEALGKAHQGKSSAWAVGFAAMLLSLA
jgi:hypothetical protein